MTRRLTQKVKYKVVLQTSRMNPQLSPLDPAERPSCKFAVQSLVGNFGSGLITAAEYPATKEITTDLEEQRRKRGGEEDGGGDRERLEVNTGADRRRARSGFVKSVAGI